MKIRTISAIAAILAISAALTGCAGTESSVDEISSAPGSSVTSENAGTAENAVSADSFATGEAQTADAKPETAQTEQTAEADSDAEVGSAQAAEKLMSDVNGTYVPLFGVILQDKYKSVWDNTCLSVLGDEEAAAGASEMLRNVCAGTVYGEDAAAAYADAPDSAQFYCGFTEGVAEITFADGTISGTDESGAQVFSHEYSFCGYNGDMGFYEYKTDDENSGEFAYFLLRADTPASTYHIEFRYGSDEAALLNYTEGRYAYWMASGIIRDCADEAAENSIKLFCTENLS